MIRFANEELNEMRARRMADCAQIHYEERPLVTQKAMMARKKASRLEESEKCTINDKQIQSSAPSDGLYWVFHRETHVWEVIQIEWVEWDKCLYREAEAQIWFLGSDVPVPWDSIVKEYAYLIGPLVLPLLPKE